ncbi:MAG: hypothetical protein IJI41_03850 [Anaerolineaceae bacterium]|nr:hypothetical protein [Anaerolineaceae bacterium]
MYDILRLMKQIYRKQPPKFWYTVLFLIALIAVAKPLVSTVIEIVNPPEPTATPRPTPELSQTGKSGEALLVLDTYYTILGYQEFDSYCTPLTDSSRNEAEKTVVIEFLARHYGDEPVELSSFYLKDGSGRNYILSSSDRIEDYRGECVDPVSEGISRPGTEISLTRGYGSHYYFYSRNIPRAAENLEFTFQVGYKIPYEVTGTPAAGSSKVFIPLEKPGTVSDPPSIMLGAPVKNGVSEDRTALAGNVAVAVNDVNRIEGDNDRTGYYMELLFKNVSGRLLDLNVSSEFSFAVVDDYGVALPAALSMNRGYNASVAPDETQKYYLQWSMEQKSVILKNLYLRISRKNYSGEVFIRIPFKESMLITPTAIPNVPEYLNRTPVPEPSASAAAPSPTERVRCINTLPPILKPGDNAAVTYTPPVANRLRSKPGFSGGVIGMMNPGSVFYVMDGPVCADDLYWYYVSYNGTYGWTAESDEGRYWLERR